MLAQPVGPDRQEGTQAAALEGRPSYVLHSFAIGDASSNMTASRAQASRPLPQGDHLPSRVNCQLRAKSGLTRRPGRAAGSDVAGRRRQLRHAVATRVHERHRTSISSATHSEVQPQFPHGPRTPTASAGSIGFSVAPTGSSFPHQAAGRTVLVHQHGYSAGALTGRAR